MMYSPPVNLVVQQGYQDPNKLTVALDTFTYRYKVSTMYPQFFGEGYEICKQLVEKIEKECDYYRPFVNFRKYLRVIPFAFFILVPLVFGLSVLWGTTQNFSLVYLSSAIFFCFVIFNLVLNICMHSKFESQMQIYNEKSNSIVSKYNNEHLHLYNLRAQYRYEVSFFHGYRRARRQVDLFIDFIKLNPQVNTYAVMMPQNIPLGVAQGYPAPGQPGQFYPNQGNFNQGYQQPVGYQGAPQNNQPQVNYGGVYGPPQNL